MDSPKPLVVCVCVKLFNTRASLRKRKDYIRITTDALFCFHSDEFDEMPRVYCKASTCFSAKERSACLGQFGLNTSKFRHEA